MVNTKSRFRVSGRVHAQNRPPKTPSIPLSQALNLASREAPLGALWGTSGGAPQAKNRGIFWRISGNHLEAEIRGGYFWEDSGPVFGPVFGCPPNMFSQ
jgi:hypothetical protein